MMLSKLLYLIRQCSKSNFTVAGLMTRVQKQFKPCVMDCFINIQLTDTLQQPNSEQWFKDIISYCPRG